MGEVPRQHLAVNNACVVTEEHTGSDAVLTGLSICVHGLMWLGANPTSPSTAGSRSPASSSTSYTAA